MVAKRSLRWIALAVAVPLCLPFLYRVPQALLSQLLPNDYVYRFSVSVDYDGKTYTGEAVSGCRRTRDGWPDWTRFPEMGDGWHVHLWSTGINVQLPNGRFLLIPNVWSCNPTAFRPNPPGMVAVGLVSNFLAPQSEKYQALSPTSPVFLFDDIKNPKTQIEIATPQGLAALGLNLSSVSVSPATWWISRLISLADPARPGSRRQQRAVCRLAIGTALGALELASMPSASR